MARYTYKHAAIFANEVSARNVMSRILTLDSEKTRMNLLSPIDYKPKEGMKSRGKLIRNKALHDAVYGGASAAVGSGIASVAATSLKIAAFAGHPLLTSAAVVGYGAMLGGASGVIAGGFKGKTFIQPLEKALDEGHWVLIVHSEDKATDEQISELLEQTFTEKIYEES